MKLLYVGRVHFADQKNLKELFDAVSQLNIPWSLDIVGDGEDLVQCQSYVDTLGIQQNITWHGWQENALGSILRIIFREASCLVLTSMDRKDYH